jgi:plasmid maintenance system antidote protein VapI
MIQVERIAAVLKAKNINPTAAGRIIELSPSKMSKIMAGEQSLTPTAIGILIKEFDIYPNWLFGYEGSADEVMYMKDLVPKSEVEARDRQIQELKNELGEVYKQLAEERRNK